MCWAVRALIFMPPAILVHPLQGTLADELDLRPVDFVERHARLAGLDLRLERVVELIKRRFAQVHDFGKVSGCKAP